jgi:subtilisin-like proprotein convertase family protein
VGQGVRLEIVAAKLQDGRWNLAVINERGVHSIWFESFATAEAAFEVARTTIEEEGIEEFVSIEGLEYLDD